MSDALMYHELYGLTGAPFQLTPDGRFFFGSIGHSRAMAHLTYGLAQEEGFIVITGEVGAGKTTLIEHLWPQINRSNFIVARIMNTMVAGEDLLRLTAAAFGIEEIGLDRATLLMRLENGFRSHRMAGQRCVLVVDEAQGLSVTALEELRMLSNSTHDGRALLQAILLGQPQFRRTLASPGLDQLRQRVLASYHLGPLSEEETRGYIEHRLKAVGWSGRPAWEQAAFASIYYHTGGIPRRINRLCSRALLYGALEEVSEITAAMVETTALELQQDLGDLSIEAGWAVVSEGIAPNGHDIERRVLALEQMAARREQTFRRLRELLDVHAGARGGAP
jgi:general secretion pathway protein A